MTSNMLHRVAIGCPLGRRLRGDEAVDCRLVVHDDRLPGLLRDLLSYEAAHESVPLPAGNGMMI